jgi:hypothetical protein
MTRLIEPQVVLAAHVSEVEEDEATFRHAVSHGIGGQYSALGG